jgi:hypothetical protein
MPWLARGKLVLNFTSTKLGSFDIRGSNLVLTFIVCRAFGGRDERNRRAVFAFGENGLKTVDTSVRNRVIMMKRLSGSILQSFSMIIGLTGYLNLYLRLHQRAVRVKNGELKRRNSTGCRPTLKIIVIR